MHEGGGGGGGGGVWWVTSFASWLAKSRFHLVKTASFRSDALVARIRKTLLFFKFDKN